VEGVILIFLLNTLQSNIILAPTHALFCVIMQDKEKIKSPQKLYVTGF